MADNIKNQFNQSTLNNPVFNFSKQEIPKFLSPGPFIPDVFLDREKDLEKVHERLFYGKNNLLLVNGEGGIGKTAFAAKYWQLYEGDYQHLAWVYRGNKLLDALLALAPKLIKQNFPKTVSSKDRLEKMLEAMLNLDKPCLLVLDNVNDVNEISKYYLVLKRCPNFHILLTTRVASFEQAATYPIPPLKAEHALELFKKHYPGYPNDKDQLLKDICSDVGCNTLVLELLAKNFAKLNSDEVIYSLEKLLWDLQQKGLFELERERKITYADMHNGLVFIEIKPSEVLAALYDDKIMVIPLKEHEKCLLSNFSVLPAEKIAYVQLKTLLVPADAGVFSKTLTDLAQRGWLEKSIQADGSTQYKISPVVQKITRNKNRPHLLEHIRTLIHTLIEKLTFDPGSWRIVNTTHDEEVAVYVKYAEFLVNHVPEEDENLKYLRDLTNLHERIAIYDEKTNLDKARFSLRKYNRSIKVLSNAHPRNQILKEELALSYSRLGDAHAALGHMKRALPYRIKDIELTKALSMANPQDLAIKNELAISNEKAGDTCKALGDMQRASAFFEHDFNLSKELYKASPQNEDFINGLAIASEKLREIHIALGDKVQASRIDEECSSLEKERYDEYQHNQVLKISLVDSISQLRQFNWDHRGDKIKAKESVELYYQPEQEPKWTRQRQGKNLSSVTGFGGN